VISDPSRPAALGLTAEALTALTDPSAILDHLARLGDTVETDPRLAVSTAKTLIESTAKSVLTARGIAYTRSDKVPALVTRAQQSLALSAKGVKRRSAGATSDPAVLGDLGAGCHRDPQSGRRRPWCRKCADLGPAQACPARRRCRPGVVPTDAGDPGRPGRTVAKYNNRAMSLVSVEDRHVRKRGLALPTSQTRASSE